MEMKVILIIFCLLLVGCNEEPVIEPNDVAEPNGYILQSGDTLLSIFDGEYEIIIEEPNHFVVETWTPSQLYSTKTSVNHVKFYDLVRIELIEDYVVKIREPNHLLIDKK